MHKAQHILACDIGGTKTNLAIFSTETGPLKPVYESTLNSSDYPDAVTIIMEFLSGHHITPVQACIGVAGPVINNRSSTTNLPWLLDGNEIGKSTGIKTVTLVNDLQATAAATPLLDDKDLWNLNNGLGLRNGNIAVISPGTGLGESFLTWDSEKGSYIAHASEGGHTDFAPSSEAETEMLIYLREKIGHVSYESVCSGRGLSNIYEFLKISGRHEEPEWLKTNLIETDDPGKMIIEIALDTEKNSLICDETVNIFLSILGAEAGNLALKVMATGGIFIGGGIPARITELLDTTTFLKSFLNKGRMSHLLAQIPVNVILDPKAPLKGAAQIALNEINPEA